MGCPTLGAPTGLDATRDAALGIFFMCGVNFRWWDIRFNWFHM